MQQSYTLNNLLSDYAIALGILTVGSIAISRIVRFKSSLAHWFAVHAIANAFISYKTCYDVFNIFVEPETALYRPIEMGSIDYSNAIMLGALHLFHFVAFWNDITGEDIFHHVLFVGFNQLGIFWPLLMWKNLQWGPIINGFNFFTCGLPGGIDYACLSVLKEMKTRASMDNKEEKAAVTKFIVKHKNIQAFVNVWIRAPGIVSMCALSLFEARRNWAKVPAAGRVIPILAFFILGYNALHYMERVVASAGLKADFKGTC